MTTYTVRTYSKRAAHVADVLADGQAIIGLTELDPDTAARVMAALQHAWKTGRADARASVELNDRDATRDEIIEGLDDEWPPEPVTCPDCGTTSHDGYCADPGCRNVGQTFGPSAETYAPGTHPALMGRPILLDGAVQQEMF